MADQPAARVLRDLPCSARSSTPRSLRLSATPRWALGAAHHNTLPLHGSRSRRLAVSASATEETSGGPERFYFNFIGFPFPLGLFLNRRTTRTEMRAIASDIWWDPEFFRVQFTGGAIKYDVSKCEIIFVPLCDMNHWSCFAFNLRKRLVHILDSNKTGKGEDIDTGSNHIWIHPILFKAVQQYMTLFFSDWSEDITKWDCKEAIVPTHYSEYETQLSFHTQVDGHTYLGSKSIITT